MGTTTRRSLPLIWPILAALILWAIAGVVTLVAAHYASKQHAFMPPRWRLVNDWNRTEEA